MDNRAYAITKYIRIPPQKARLAAALIRGKDIEGAEAQLRYCPMKASQYLKKTLQSAVANAELQFDARRDRLRVVEVRVDQGPSFKRSKSRAKGGRSPILKRTCHFTVVVAEAEQEK